MKKNVIIKIMSFACVTAMAVSFASCAKKPASTVPSASEPSVSDVSEPTSGDKLTNLSETTLNDSTVASQTSVTDGTVNVRPTDTASAVQLYNNAIAKKGTVSATISREMLGGKVAVIEIASIAPTAAEQFRLKDSPLPGADIYALDASSVANTSVQEVGENYVITFTLNDANLNLSSTYGDSGYMYYLDVAMIGETINNIGQSIMNDPTYDFTIKEDKVDISATNGKFVVTINKATGAISSAEISFMEDIRVPLSKPIPGIAKVQCEGSAKFTIA